MARTNLGPKVATIKDIKTAGTVAATITPGAFRTRELNTLSDTSNIGITLVSNQFTLPAGTYSIVAFVGSYRADGFGSRLRNITDSLDQLIGKTGYTRASDMIANSLSEVSGTFTITGTKTFEIQQVVQTSSTEQPAGVGVSEVYTDVTITKTA